MYYNNIECEVILEINDSESVIEIDVGSESYQDEFGIYDEPISRKLIVNNNYITAEKITQSSIIEDKKKMLIDVEKQSAKKFTEANELIRNEKQKLNQELKELKDKITRFDGMLEFYNFVNNDYQFFFSKSGIGKSKIVRKDEMLLYKDGRDTKEKAVGFKCILISDKDTQRYAGKFRIGMEVYHYSDGSGGANYVQGYKTLEEAIFEYKDYLKSDINITSHDVETCNKFNIVNEKVISYEVKQKNKQKENNEKEIKRLEANIIRLENA